MVVAALQQTGAVATDTGDEQDTGPNDGIDDSEGFTELKDCCCGCCCGSKVATMGVAVKLMIEPTISGATDDGELLVVVMVLLLLMLGLLLLLL